MKICFWGNIAGAINGRTDGGAELQIALLAKALALVGHEVVVVDLKIKEDFITVEGIKVFKINGFNDGIRFIRTITHRLPKIYCSLKAQHADVYYCRIRDFRHILAYFASRKIGAKFILHMASDLDAMNWRMRFKNYKAIDLSNLYGWTNSILVEIVHDWILRKADLLLAQHSGQKDILQKRNIKSTVLFNLIDLSRIPLVPNQIQKDFIYVGALDKRKGFVEFFELVKKSPLHTFKVIGSTRDKTGVSIYNKLKSYPNVTLLGELNHYDTLSHIAKSKALISTSLIEGFPNIFIEAWVFGIPVLSLNVDPGDVIKKEKLGVVTNGDIDKLKQAMDNTINTNEFAVRAKAYVEKNHALNANKVKEINDLFCSL